MSSSRRSSEQSAMAFLAKPCRRNHSTESKYAKKHEDGTYRVGCRECDDLARKRYSESENKPMKDREIIRGYLLTCGDEVRYKVPPLPDDILWCYRCNDWVVYGPPTLTATCENENHKPLEARNRTELYGKAYRHYKSTLRHGPGCMVTLHFPEGDKQWLPKALREEEEVKV